MSKNEDSKAFTEKYNLPAGGEKLDPNTCTCGKAGCQQHETWGEYLLKQIFTENETNPDVQITMDDFEPYLSKPEYDPVIYAGKFTQRDYDKYLDQKKAEITADTTIKDKTSAYYNNWMERRSGNYFEFYSTMQKQEIHQEGNSQKGYIICTCSLITDLKSGSDPKDLWQYPGHITHPSKEPVKLFAVETENENGRYEEKRIWCQTCGDIGAAKLTKTGNVSGAYVRTLAAKHVCSN